MQYRTIIILLIALAALCSAPALGLSTKYLGANPEMSAYLYGVNEFSPGSDATITLKIQNSAVNSMVFLNATQQAYDDPPTTAKFVTASLGSAGSPFQVKTDPQSLGDIARQGTVTAKFNVKIFSNATIGEYQLPLTLTYRYLNVQPQELGDTVYTTYHTVIDTIPITVKVKPTVTIHVLSAVPENLNVGTEGYLDLTIKNTGGINGKDATVKIIRNGNSPVIPTDSSVFIGDFPQNGTISCRYKVAVSSAAGAQTYPVDVAVVYVNPEGDTVTSAYETVGVPVGSKISFTVTSPPATLYPGETKVLVFEYQNTGTSPVYRAQARLNVVAPFSSTDNSAYLGDIAPGARGTARYTLTADSDAPVTNYTLDTEIRYRDVFDNSQISGTFPAVVQLVPAPGYTRLMPFLPVAVVAVLILIGAGYYVLIMRKKK